MKISLIAISFCFFVVQSTSAQHSWRKNRRSAETAFQEGKFAEAASLYEAAWKSNSKKTKYIYQAAETYAMIRDYQRAAECYKIVKDDKEFLLAKLYFARCLKQSGSPEKAIAEYASFISNYGGTGADKLRDIVQVEIRGCEFAIQSTKSAAKNPIQISRLGSTINSNEAEFAPIALGEDILYFSSNFSGKATIYRSQKQNGNWTKAVLPSGFPELKGAGICNGSFSSDNKRFYFTECTADKGLQALCAIYVMNRSGDRWLAPQKLTNSINVEGFTSTHPSIANIGGKEYLFFSSNKPGGKGGMDIYQSRIYTDKKELTLSNPVSLGENINTEGDEITPFFDASENCLYFSSNANLTIGGLDIQKSKLLESTDTYGKTENAGMPYNSAADDYYFVKGKNKNAGFLVSNRSTKERPNTTNEDIFEFVWAPQQMMAKGKVFDKNSLALIIDCRVNLYEITESAQRRLLNTKVIKDGKFEFNLLPDKKFRIEAEKKGFLTNYFDFSTSKDSLSKVYEKNLLLVVDVKSSTQPSGAQIEEKPLKVNSAEEKVISNEVDNKEAAIVTKVDAKQTRDNPATKGGEVKTNVDKAVVKGKSTDTKRAESPTKKQEESKPIVVNTPTKKEEKATFSSNENQGIKPQYVSSPSALDEKRISTENVNKGLTSVGTMPLYETKSHLGEHLISSAPKLEGIYYKIQIIALKRFDFEEKRYDPIKDMGRVDTEYIVKRDMVRVLLADFFQLEDAQKMLIEVRRNREFAGAFVVKYADGIRY
ncbi:MAG: hypothetical protein ACOYOA_04010 [Saprospiraceae bacterium]